jgi:2-methylcitrate dehydratase PrpD
VKPFPCCRATHQAIDLALGLRQRDPSIAQRIVDVEVRAPRPTLEMVGSPFEPGANPRVAAQFSIPYTVAVALRRGSLGLADFEAERVAGDHDTAAYARRIRVEGFALKPGEGMYDPPLEMKVRLDDGSRLELETSVVKGSPRHPMTKAETEAKLRDCAGRDVHASHVDALRAAVAAIDRDGLRPAMSLLRFASAGEVSDAR